MVSQAVQTEEYETQLSMNSLRENSVNRSRVNNIPPATSRSY